MGQQLLTWMGHQLQLRLFTLKFWVHASRCVLLTSNLEFQSIWRTWHRQYQMPLVKRTGKLACVSIDYGSHHGRQQLRLQGMCESSQHTMVNLRAPLQSNSLDSRKSTTAQMLISKITRL